MIRKLYYPDDCLKLQKRLLEINYYADLAEVQCFWKWHSEQLDVSWFTIDEQDRGEYLEELVFQYSVRDEVF